MTRFKSNECIDLLKLKTIHECPFLSHLWNSSIIRFMHCDVYEHVRTWNIYNAGITLYRDWSRVVGVLLHYCCVKVFSGYKALMVFIKNSSWCDINLLYLSYFLFISNYSRSAIMVNVSKKRKLNLALHFVLIKCSSLFVNFK